MFAEDYVFYLIIIMYGILRALMTSLNSNIFVLIIDYAIIINLSEPENKLFNKNIILFGLGQENESKTRENVPHE